MLAIDGEGNLHIIELKKNRAPREVVAQALDYASWVQNLSYDQVLRIYEDKNNGPLEEAFAEKFDDSLPDKLNDTHQITIVSSQLDSETERIDSPKGGEQSTSNSELILTLLTEKAQISNQIILATIDFESFYDGNTEKFNKIIIDNKEYNLLSINDYQKNKTFIDSHVALFFEANR